MKGCPCWRFWLCVSCFAGAHVWRFARRACLCGVCVCGGALYSSLSLASTPPHLLGLELAVHYPTHVPNDVHVVDERPVLLQTAHVVRRVSALLNAAQLPPPVLSLLSPDVAPAEEERES